MSSNLPLSAFPSGRILGIGALLYVTPRIMSLMSVPPQGIPVNCIERVRERAFATKEKLREIVGEKVWFVATEVVADHAWISFLALSILTKGAPLFTNLGRGLDIATAFFGMCTVSWLIHFSESFIRSKWEPDRQG